LIESFYVHFSEYHSKTLVVLSKKIIFTSQNLFSLSRFRTFYGAPLNDGMWHSLCVTWLSAGGHWSAYVDGKTNVRRSGDKFRNNKIVESDGQQLMLGQKIKKDGAFRESFSFTGNISRVNLWDYVMSEDQVHNVATACARPAGNVLKWRDFRDGLQGGVVLSERSQCIGAGELEEPAFFLTSGQYPFLPKNPG